MVETRIRGRRLTMLRALNLVYEIMDIISTVDVAFLAIRVVGVFGLVSDHIFEGVEMLIAAIVGAFALAHDGTGTSSIEEVLGEVYKTSKGSNKGVMTRSGEWEEE